jgi:hypothetical protein
MRTNDLNPSLQPAGLRFPMHIYDVRPRKDRRGFDLISEHLPFGAAVVCRGCGRHQLREVLLALAFGNHSLFDESGAVIETHEHAGDLKD